MGKASHIYVMSRHCVRRCFWDALTTEINSLSSIWGNKSTEKIIMFLCTVTKLCCESYDFRFSNDGNTYTNNWCLSASYYALLLFCARVMVSRYFSVAISCMYDGSFLLISRGLTRFKYQKLAYDFIFSFFQTTKNIKGKATKIFKLSNDCLSSLGRSFQSKFN